MDFLIGLVPSTCAGVALYFILRWMSRADRTERAAQRDIQKDAEQWYQSVKNSDGARNPFGSEDS